MRLLLDTHVLIWWVQGDTRLSVASRGVLLDAGNEILISSVSAMEMATKVAIGKLSLRFGPEATITRAMAALVGTELPLSIRHALAVAHLPLHHRDPFDPMLIAQALIEGATLVTPDQAQRSYAVQTIG